MLCRGSVSVNQDGSEGWTQSSDVVKGDLSVQRIGSVACVSQKYSFILIRFEGSPYSVHCRLNPRYLPVTQLEASCTSDLAMESIALAIIRLAVSPTPIG